MESQSRSAGLGESPDGLDLDLPTVSLSRVSMAYPGVRALTDVSIEFRAGEIHGLLGQNGAGKSTLIRILSGVESPSDGQLRFDENAVELSGPRDAMARGVAVVHQEFQSLPNMTVLENVLLGSSHTGRAAIRWREAAREARSALDRVGLEDVDLATTMSDLTPAQRKLVEIARALRHAGTRLLLLDEPTAALDSSEAKVVLNSMTRLRSHGASIVFISHHLDEVMEVCDRVTVLRDGRSVGTWAPSQVTQQELVDVMVGGEFDRLHERGSVDRTGSPRVSARDWSVADQVEPMALDVYAGEIVGLCGLVGCGKSELARSLFGAERGSTGTLTIDGQRVKVGSPAEAVAAGIAYVPADRQREGMIFTLDLTDNISLAILKRLRRGGRLSARAQRETASKFFDRLNVKATSLQQLPGGLSGGNQQKVLLGRWLASNPRFIVLDDPTQGIDIAAKAEVHRVITELADAGLAVLLISSDVEELAVLADRTIVMQQGRVIDELQRGVDQSDLVLAMTATQESVA